MTLDDWAEWAKKWGPLIGISLAIIAVIQRHVAAFGFSWTVAGYIFIALLAFILGYLVHYWLHKPNPKADSSPDKPSHFSRPHKRTYYFRGFDWPYSIRVVNGEPKTPIIDEPLCPIHRIEATIEPYSYDGDRIDGTVIFCPINITPAFKTNQ